MSENYQSFDPYEVILNYRRHGYSDAWLIAKLALAIPTNMREQLNAAQADNDRLKADNDLLRIGLRDYDELIMAVRTKYPGETRHQTALRYILQAEAPFHGTGAQQGAALEGEK